MEAVKNGKEEAEEGQEAGWCEDAGSQRLLKQDSTSPDRGLDRSFAIRSNRVPHGAAHLSGHILSTRPVRGPRALRIRVAIGSE